MTLHAAGRGGASPDRAAGPSAVTIELADGLGLPVLSVGAMVADRSPASSWPPPRLAAGRTGSLNWCGRLPPWVTPMPHRRMRCSSRRRPRRQPASTTARTGRWPRCRRG
ncbi:putative polyketide synthase pks12 domain protein [Mycobacterium xenopi 3993]|nr:putative polyketide synthase pks12 domain protein [Mycobacterium xenopi 3993]